MIDVEIAKKFWQDHAHVDVSTWEQEVSRNAIIFSRSRRVSYVKAFKQICRRTIGSNPEICVQLDFQALQLSFANGRFAKLYYDASEIRLELYDYGYEA